MATSSWGKAAAFETRAALDGVGDEDIHYSRLTGMSPHDIEAIRRFSIAEGLLIIIRCPKRAARYQHGLFQPKTYATSLLKDPATGKGLKSDPATGLVTLPDGRRQVSDYDLMCVYRLAGPNRFQKVFFSAVSKDNPKSRLRTEAAALLRNANWDLLSPFQHGAQDDLDLSSIPGKKHPGVAGSSFIAFNAGSLTYLPTPAQAKAFYDKLGLMWPYNASGEHQLSSDQRSYLDRLRTE